MTSSATATPMAATGPRPRVEFVSANSRHSMPTMTVAPLAMIAGPGAVQRDGHRLVPVLVPAQLLAVAGDQQQRVVRARAEDQHGEDAGALRVDGQAGVLGEQVDHGLGDDQRDAGRDHRQQPEHRAAVGDQQDDDDDGERREQQRAVDALERRRPSRRRSRPGR